MEGSGHEDLRTRTSGDNPVKGGSRAHCPDPDSASFDHFALKATHRPPGKMAQTARCLRSIGG
jgi:hypothetical protein